MSWNDKRPMSPHLQIYDLPLTAKISIMHRMTGAFLLLGLFIIVLVLSSVALGESYWLMIKEILNSWPGLLVLFGLTFSVYFHFCHGIRHLIWDTGRYLEKNMQAKGAALVIGTSIVLTLLTWFIALSTGSSL
ncbi:MAG: succinate dehydrogenase, cytochrome b556 subunit [Gammaproteobacteria bacterium]|nr:succinate dehydrogenase, cytochrome b556 subunit [Gammaproteobacteria bacterium]